MSVLQKIFAYNTGSLISGTTQVGDLAISEAEVEYSANFGGLQWWGGPDETNGYVIAYPVPGCDRPTPIVGLTACIGFKRSLLLTEESFVQLANEFVGGPPAPFADGNSASTYLTNNGYWNSWVMVTPTPTPTFGATQTPTITPTTTPTTTSTPTTTTTPTSTETPTPTPTLEPTTTPTNTETPTPEPTTTPTNTETPTPEPTTTPTNTETPTPTNTETPTNTPTLTQTPTETDLSSVTTYTISGCTNLNVLIADLGPGALAPGDVFNLTFTGGTPSGCYRIVSKTVGTPADGSTPLFFYVNCNLCEASLVTPTPTTTATPTETPTNTPTPSITPEPVTGYSFNLVILPYNFPATGNTIMNQGAVQTGTTNPNELTISGRGIYFNSIDSDGIDRTSYFSQFTGQSITITMTQTGSTAIYSGDTDAFKYWSATTGTPPGVPGDGFVFGTGVGINPNPPSGVAVLIQSATTNWTVGLPVYISVEINAGVTPTPTPTNTTTPTNTETPTQTPTPEPTTTPTNTETPTQTPTPEPTTTPTNTETSTPTQTPEPTTTPTNTETPTNTPTPEPTTTPTNTPTPTLTQTPTPTSASTPSGFSVTIVESGGNVVMSASGSLNINDLTLVNPSAGPFGFGGIGVSTATFLMGTNGINAAQYSGFTTTPPNFGPGGVGGSQTSVSGNIFGVIKQGPTAPYSLLVPVGYTTGTAISSSQTFTGTTFSGLGLTQGTYTYTWGSGANADSINVVVGG
jgi:hypothetical protein